MSTLLFWLMLASLVSVGIVSPTWREIPLAAVALTSGLLMYFDDSSDMPLWVRTVLWLAVSLAYTAAQWQLRVGEEGSGLAEPSDLFAPVTRPEGSEPSVEPAVGSGATAAT